MDTVTILAGAIYFTEIPCPSFRLSDYRNNGSPNIGISPGISCWEEKAGAWCQSENGHVSQKEKDCTRIRWCCMKKLQPSQRWTHNEWDHNTPWLGLRSAVHTSGPLRKAKAYTALSLSLFPMWPHWINLLLFLIIITYLFNQSFVCFLEDDETWLIRVLKAEALALMTPGTTPLKK